MRGLNQTLPGVAVRDFAGGLLRWSASSGHGGSTMYMYLISSQYTRAHTDALPSAEGSRPWSVCNDAIALPDDHPFSMLPTLEELLGAGYHLLLYNGEHDLSCNFLGTEAYADALDWSGKHDWAKATRSIWRVRSGALGGTHQRRRLGDEGGNDAEADPAAPATAPAVSKDDEDGVVAGYYRTAGPLHFLVVLNSGCVLLCPLLESLSAHVAPSHV